MQKNNNLSPLPWYNSINEQNHRKSYAYGAVYPLYTRIKTVLPFQVVREHRANSIQSVLLYDIKGTLVADITASMIETGLQIISFSSLGYDVIVYYGLLPILQNQLIGQYYAVMTDGVETWYSEVWTAIEDVQSYLKLEWYNKENVAFDGGQIVYEQIYYRNYLYLDAEIGKPEYKFEEEGEERDGYFFPEKQISEKVYKSVILAPEFLCDCMRLIRMADYVRITDKFGRVYNCDTFLITPEWQVQGDLASVEMEFQTDTVVKKIGRGYTIPSGADFNDDYNNDFNN